MLRLQSAGIRLCLFSAVFVAANFSIFTTSAHAQSDADPVEYEEDYDFSWLDPDKKIYVVQNRKYLKGRHIELSLGAGLNLSGAYTNSSVVIARGAYYFTEQFGVGALGGWQSNSASPTLTELRLTGSSVLPNVRDVTSFYGGSFIWIPFYGKFNLFNQIVYVDWELQAGIASISSNVNLNFTAGGTDAFLPTSATGFMWGTGFKFFVSQIFAVRFDMLATYFSAPVYRRGAITSTSSTNDHDY